MKPLLKVTGIKRKWAKLIEAELNKPERLKALADEVAKKQVRRILHGK